MYYIFFQKRKAKMIQRFVICECVRKLRKTTTAGRFKILLFCNSRQNIDNFPREFSFKNLFLYAKCTARYEIYNFISLETDSALNKFAFVICSKIKFVWNFQIGWAYKTEYFLKFVRWNLRLQIIQNITCIEGKTFAKMFGEILHLMDKDIKYAEVRCKISV